MSKTPSPCIDVCKFKREGHCIGCSMTKAQKSLFKELKKDKHREAFVEMLVGQQTMLGRYRATHGPSGRELDAQVAHTWWIENGRVTGVVTKMGLKFRARTVVLTTGTFLGGIIHIGLENHQGGRAGDPPSNALAARLREMPFHVERLKTGTPARLDARRGAASEKFNTAA